MKEALERRHLRFGWYALTCFSVLGIALELLHAFKLGFYLDVGSETRRWLWRLGHAHGTLLALINVAFGCSVGRLAATERHLARASACLIGAALLLPLGFLLGGAFATPADPSPLVALVPAGAVLLIIGTWTAARAAR